MKTPNVRVGTAYLLGAQSVFFVSGYVMHIVLGRSLGPVEYGLFGIALYAATMIRTAVGSGFPMAVSRYVSAELDRAEEVFRQGLKLQLLLALSISVVFFIFAPRLAELLGDNRLTFLFRIVSPITVFFGLFFLVIQYHNGLRLYKIQSFWLAVSYLLRALFAIILAVLGYRAAGATGGLTLAALAAAILVLIFRKPLPRTTPYPASKMVAFAAPLVLASATQALLVDLDIMFVKRLVPDAGSAGYYTSAKALASAIPFAFYALSSALYPAISGTYAEQNWANLKGYIRKANRLILLAVAPVLVILFTRSEAILVSIYGSEYTRGAFALSWLGFSFSLLAIFIIHKTIINGCGFPRISSIITLVLLPVCVTLQMILVPKYGLAGAATGSGITFGMGALISTVIILMKFKAGFVWLSSCRILCCAVLMAACTWPLQIWGVPLIPSILILGTVYMVAIKITGELSSGELKELLKSFTRAEK